MLKSNTLDEYSNKSSIATIGTFDGVHIGHQKIIERLVNTANQENLQAVVLTFFPHPRMVLQKDANIKLINTIEERSAILKKLGIDHLCVKTFTKEFSRLSAEDFVKEILVKQLHIKKIIIGYDHHFGRNRAANIQDLIKFGKTYNFEVEEISAQDINDVSVSSTKIRKALLAGDMQTANAYLGYNFMLNGTVIKGKGLGKTIDFPTANLSIPETYKLIPKQGVYVVTATYKNQKLFGMMNIGTNPTISNSTKLTIEVHFFDFNEDIYDQNIAVKVLKRIRSEQKFDSLEALKAQIQQDKIDAERYITQNNIE
ncbi:bifunctional riboflavin kinase/FAD synthetase [Lacinutrix sp. C3R15]|uniref:bifunctional riboflavin kinase/FAD synthetase n=1 Tax=Flavobacteriaceae TaxID=49546 RepID=UPI001C097509|nr:MULTISPECIES: bifunctional riboflavin kinase/FAD synthetase [Flavobacteriaceae]MBU2938294.1 bifunctional riboflavin kinase/FAD synthetase [Lacinutrix sp. C3R15]MDO6621608.1 bifunctional riboflavin kinase/FAD synthetase [Oceanihabitans sp. 1_MG-2023]